MSLAAIGAWVLVAALGVMTPGIDTMLVLRHTIVGGVRPGLYVVVGIASGCLIWATASLAGLTALLVASRLAYDVVQIAGAVYLVLFGLLSLWRTLPRGKRAVTEAGEDVDTPFEGSAGSLRAGFFTNLLNPKVGVFYISLLPQFLPTGPGAVSWGVLLVVIHLAVTFLWYPLLISLATRARTVLLRRAVRRWMERAVALVLIGVGVGLALE